MEKKPFTTSIHDKQYLTYLLLDRFQIEIDKGNYRDANLVAQNLFWLYPEEKDARRKLEDIYISKAEGLMREDNLKEAEKALKSALKLEEANPRFLLISTRIERKLDSRLKTSRGVEILARKLMQALFPEESSFFDLAWRVFKNMQPEDFSQEAMSGSLGLVGDEGSKLNTPKVIVLLNKLVSQDIDMLPDEKAKQAITKIGRAMGCPPEVIDKTAQFILGT
jgi:hypothetical protein